MVQCVSMPSARICVRVPPMTGEFFACKASATRIDRLNRQRVMNQADSWWTGNVFLSIRYRWKVPPKLSASTASANDNEKYFLAGYLNCSWRQNKRVLLDTLAANKHSFHRARLCGTMDSLAGNHDDAIVQIIALVWLMLYKIPPFNYLASTPISVPRTPLTNFKAFRDTCKTPRKWHIKCSFFADIYHC